MGHEGKGPNFKRAIMPDHPPEAIEERSLITRVVMGVFVEFLSWTIGALLVFGTIAATRHPLGFVVISIGILLLIWAVLRKMLRQPLFQPDRPLWMRILVGVVLFGPLFLFAVAAVLILVNVGWMMASDQFPSGK